MTAIIIPRRHYTQPQGRVTVAPEWGGASLLVPHDGGLWDAVSGEALSPVGSVTALPCEQGLCVTGNGYFDVPTSAYSLEVPFSVFFLYRTRAYTGTRPVIVTNPAYAGSDRLMVRGPDYNDYRRLEFSNLSNYSGGIVLTQNPSFAKNQWVPVMWAQPVKEAGAAYLPDIEVSTPAATANPYRPPAPTMLVSPGIDGHDLAVFALLPRVCGKDEYLELARNPWQLFRADPDRIYSLPSGAISLSINSITASGVTQTGARITLGLTR